MSAISMAQFLKRRNFNHLQKMVLPVAPPFDLGVDFDDFYPKI
jgi:hypothetical protein